MKLTKKKLALHCVENKKDILIKFMTLSGAKLFSRCYESRGNLSGHSKTDGCSPIIYGLYVQINIKKTGKIA